MTSTADNARPGGKTERVVLVLTSVFLVITFLRRLLPVAERPGSAETLMSVAFEIGMTVGVVGLGSRVLKSIPRGAPSATGWKVLLVAGVVAAIGILVIRLSGGPRVELPPRATQSSSETSIFPPDLRQFAERVRRVSEAYQQAEAAAENTLWQKTPASDYPKLPRSALKERIAKQAELLGATDRLLDLMSEPDFEPKIARFRGIAEGRGYRLPSNELNPHAWRLLRRIYDGNHKVYLLVDANWDEWQANPVFEPNNLKPWQQEVVAVLREVKVAEKERDELAQKQSPVGVIPEPTPNARDVEVAKLKSDLKAAHASYKRRWDALSASRWAQIGFEDPRDGNLFSYAAITPGAIPKLRKLRRADLSEFRQAQRALLDSYDEVFGLFRDAETKNFDPFNVGVDLGGHHRKFESWQASQRVHAIAYAQSEVLEQNWEDWRLRGLRKDGRWKPWQERIRQLQSEFDGAMAEWQTSR